MSKKRITQIITGLDIGGAEMMLANLLSHMDRDSFVLEVISLTESGPIASQIEEMGIPVRVLGMKRGHVNPADFLRLAKWLRESRPNLIQTWMYHANLAGGLAAKLAGGIPVIWGIHASHLEIATMRQRIMRAIPLSARLSRWLPTRIVYCSEVSHHIHASLGYDEGGMLVIPNGFDTEAFAPDPQARVAVRDELGVSSDTPLIGMAARFDPQKDHENFFKAAALLHAEMPEVQFVLCGAGVTPDNAAVRRWVQEGGLDGHCHILGRRRDVARLMASLDLATTSSSFGEAFPMVVGESMACEVPCVVTDVGDSTAVVGDTGRSVPPRNPRALAEAWMEILRQDSSDRRRLGAAARARIIELYSLTSVTARYESLYREVME